MKSSTPELKLVDSIDEYQVFQVPGPSGFFTSPGSSLTVASNRAAFDRVTDPDFDPTSTVVVERDGAGPVERADGAAGTVDVTHLGTTAATVVVRRSSPGFVVFNQNHYPGWRATVDGKDVPVERANSTFMAVQVPAGTSTVEFRFEPSSVRIGAIISVIAACSVLAAATASRVRRRDRA